MIKNLLSIDESKGSILIWTFLISTVIGLYIAVKFGDMPPNLVNFLGWLIGAIAGINAMSRYVERKEPPGP